MNLVTFVKRWIVFTLACGAVGAVAQDTNTPTTSTNLALAITVNLTAYVQSTNDAGLPSATVTKLGNKDIIAALGTDFGMSSNDLVGAKLIALTTGIADTNVPSPPVNRVLRTNSGDTNINVNLGIFPSFNPSVQTVRGSSGGSSISTIYTTASLSLTTSNLNVDAKGQFKLITRPVTAGGKIIDSRGLVSSVSAFVTGTGKVGTNAATFIGTYSLSNPKVEVQTQ